MEAEYDLTESAREVLRLEARERELLAANNLEIDKRRKFEAEANQQHCEIILLRNECIRLRNVIEHLADFIEECHENSGDPIPEEIQADIDAIFPKDESKPVELSC